jgi:lipoprotein-anchoring transpeptidase ErfK/SrfK
VTRSSAGVYAEPRPDKEIKFGYVRRGGKLPVLADKVPGKDCSEGWYKIASGGYICSMVGTTDENSRDVKFKPRQPNLEEILPYPYARNAHNGTPLYKTLPSRAQMLEYEPYLTKKAEPKDGTKTEAPTAGSNAGTSEKKADAAPTATPEPAAPVVPASIDANSAASTVAAPLEPEPEKPWWQREDAKDRLHEVTLDQLAEEADGVLAKRLVKGFYVAVTGTFKWNNRTWYKTTGGLVAPADRFWQTAGSDFKGVELDGETWKLPVAWVYGGNKTATTYAIDEEKKQVAPKGSVKRFTAIQLTGKTIEISKRTYHQLSDGTWVKDSLIRITTPGARPADVGENERWIDVDISEQTLVAYQGDRPVYATLISSGKESKIKDKDHSTPRGAWRVREKHMTTTMDGNGSAAGDLPYSIEDVPYVMYFHQAYALHGAFWHANYGAQMSHGCVNLAPLDAKHLFFFADPPTYEGLAGAWSNDKSPGSMVVVHD